jgi:hypothetical protein
VLRRIDPAFLALGLLFEVATVLAMASDVSILVVWAGIVLTTGSLLVGIDRADQRERR